MIWSLCGDKPLWSPTSVSEQVRKDPHFTKFQDPIQYIQITNLDILDRFWGPPSEKKHPFVFLVEYNIVCLVEYNGFCQKW